MENQAFEFLTIPTKNEWRSRSRQQEHQKDFPKMVVTYRDWYEMLPFALHAYRTTVRTSIGITPYSLVYGMEAVMPLEVKIPSLRVLMDSELQEAEWAKVRYEQLNLINEKRIAAICHHQLYQN